MQNAISLVQVYIHEKDLYKNKRLHLPTIFSKVDDVSRIPICLHLHLPSNSPGPIISKGLLLCSYRKEAAFVLPLIRPSQIGQVEVEYKSHAVEKKKRIAMDKCQFQTSLVVVFQAEETHNWSQVVHAG